jgi:Mg-chelatase subunit ChlD
MSKSKGCAINVKSASGCASISFFTMKDHLIFFLLVATALIRTAAAQSLTQQDVIKLVELKIPEQTIIERVKSSGTSFILGTDDIDRLKKAGATDALISAMQATSAAPATGSASSEITDLALIVDYSGSMNAKMKDGATKVASAKKCVTALIEKLPSDLNVALIVYGTSKKRGCEDIDIVQRLGPIDKAALKSKISDFNATGMTPIATSLTKAGEELKKAKGGSAIVLVTDGAETCHGDPAGVAAKLAAEFGVKFGINVIGFGIEPQEKAQLVDIAAKGHGKLVTVESASELADALKKTVAEKVATAPPPTPVPTATPTPTPKPTPMPTPTPTPRQTKDYEAAGQAVKPGTFFNDAPIVQPGEYKGTLAMMQALYYQVPVNKGQELRAVGIVHKIPYKAGNDDIHQNFTLTIYNSAWKMVASEKSVVNGNPQDPVTFRANWTAETGGVAYVCIAATDNYDPFWGGPATPYLEGTNPKFYYEAGIAPSPYTLRIRREGEAASASPIQGAELPGGTNFNNAAELRSPGLAVTDLKLSETAFYKIAVEKNELVEVSAAFQKPWYNAGNGEIETTYTLTLYDDDQVQVSQTKTVVKKNPPEAQTTLIDWPATVSGTAYVSVSAKHTGSSAIYPDKFEPKPGRLTVQVTKGEAGSPEPTEEESPKPTEGKKGEAAPAPEKSPSPKKPSDPFAGAESTPG